MTTGEIANLAAAGGKARAEALTPKERQEIARYAAEKRWTKMREGESNATPRATHSGKIAIGELELPCANLDDGRRVLSERGVTRALGGKRGGSHWQRRKAAGAANLPVFISAGNLAPFISASLETALAQPVLYLPRTGKTGRYGILATLIPEICEVWLKARRAGALHPSQEHLAKTAELLVSALANVGIVALVDEATGYQEVRDRQELHRILEAYIAKELLPWTKRFPDEFYQQLFRLRGWEYSPPSPKRPKMVGKLTSRIVYEKLPRGVLQQLRQRNPVVKDGWRRHRHHQFLTEDIGNRHLEKHIASVTTLMRIAPNWSSFERLLERAFPGEGIQGELGLGAEDETEF